MSHKTTAISATSSEATPPASEPTAEPREAALPTRRFLISTPLVRDSGIITAFNALKIVCERGARVTLIPR